MNPENTFDVLESSRQLSCLLRKLCFLLGEVEELQDEISDGLLSPPVRPYALRQLATLRRWQLN